jgi:hypothetical protein
MRGHGFGDGFRMGTGVDSGDAAIRGRHAGAKLWSLEAISDPAA